VELRTAAIRSRFGSLTYYIASLSVREVVAWVRPAGPTDTWMSNSVDLQNTSRVNVRAVSRQLAPYLASSPDRFVGSILAMAPAGALSFESGLAEGITSVVGVLSVKQGPLVALDGQHRLLAFREVITGGTDLGEFAAQVGDDEVCVLFIEFEDAQKTRRIFNKVNRHAKPTGRSDNIVTSEDDGNAIVTRWLLDTDRHAPLADRCDNGSRVELVNWKSNTLGQHSTHLTTISTVYETVKDILDFQDFQSFDETKKKNPVAPSDKQLEDAYSVTADWWNQILTLDAFQAALADTSTVPGIRFDPNHRHSLLLRPVGQVAFVKGLILAITRSKGNLTLTEALRRANKISWASATGSVWTNTIVRADGSKMVARNEARELAASVIADLIAEEC
jgi:DNA sulfur modification protein DndB